MSTTDKFELNAALTRLQGPPYESWVEDATSVIAAFHRLRKESPIIVEAHAVSAGRSEVNAGQTPQRETTSISTDEERHKSWTRGRVYERIGQYKVWKVDNEQLAFRHFWLGDLAAELVEGETAPEFRIRFNPATLQPISVGITKTIPILKFWFIHIQREQIIEIQRKPAARGIVRTIGRYIAAGAIGLTSLFSPIRTDATITTNEIYCHTNVVKDANFVSPSWDRAVYYGCNDVKFNNRVSEKKMVAFYSEKINPTSEYHRVIGGITLEPNSSKISQGHFNSDINGVGLTPGQVATNGNGSYWVILRDENNNQEFGSYTFDSSTGEWTITAEPGEFVGTTTNAISFTGVDPFPPAGVTNANITSIRVNGYQDFDGDNVPDYYELKYFSTLTNASANTVMPNGATLKENWIAGTDPTNVTSGFEVGLIRGTNGLPAITWNSLVGRDYTVCSKTNLAGVCMNPVPEATNLPGTGGPMTNDFILLPAEFRRIEVQLSPFEVVNPE